MNTECNNIEAYLAGDLQVEQAVDFEDHLPQCDACRETIDQQRWIDGLLRSPLRLQVEPTPVDLIVATRRAHSRRRQSVRLAACGLAAAVLICVAFGRLELNPQVSGRPGRGKSASEVGGKAATDVAAPTTATFVGGADVIAVPIESQHADVTIVRIYPTYRPRNERESVATNPNDSNFSWHDYSNGG